MHIYLHNFLTIYIPTPHRVHIQIIYEYSLRVGYVHDSGFGLGRVPHQLGSWFSALRLLAFRTVGSSSHWRDIFPTISSTDTTIAIKEGDMVEPTRSIVFNKRLMVSGCSLMFRIPRYGCGNMGSIPSNHSKYLRIYTRQKCLVTIWCRMRSLHVIYYYWWIIFSVALN